MKIIDLYNNNFRILIPSWTKTEALPKSTNTNLYSQEEFLEATEIIMLFKKIPPWLIPFEWR